MIKGTFPIERFKDIDTPFYYYDTKVLRETLDTIREELRRNPEYEVHYAIKANYDPRLLQIIREYGFGIDCASGNEVKCAIEAGFDPKTIVYAGVGKRDKEIRYAIEQGIFTINCESIEELYVVNDIAGDLGKVVNVALRVNPDIDPKTNHCIDTGQADSKFGISYEEILARVEDIKALKHLDVIGMHIHIGSQIRELHVFENMCNKVNVIVKNLTDLGFELEFVDVGGGLGVNYDMPENEPIPNFASVFAIIKQHLNVGKREVHFEFGRSIIAQCGELITKVLYNKTTATGRRLVIVDGSMTELIRPALYGAYHKIENLSAEQRTFFPTHQAYDIVGPVCESSDVWGAGRLLPLSVRGDLMAIRSAGAYGQVMASRYNMKDLAPAVFSDAIDEAPAKKDYFEK